MDTTAFIRTDRVRLPQRVTEHRRYPGSIEVLPRRSCGIAIAWRACLASLYHSKIGQIYGLRQTSLIRLL
jgi:hypothetical protein